MRRTETPKPILIKFCTVVDIHEVVTHTNFGDYRLRRFSDGGGQISPLWRCLFHGVVAGGYLFTECEDSTAMQMRRCPIRFDWLDVASRDWLGGILGACAGWLSGQFALKCVTLCQDGEEGRGGLRATVLRVVNDLCGHKERVRARRTAPCYGTSVFSFCVSTDLAWSLCL